MPAETIYASIESLALTVERLEKAITAKEAARAATATPPQPSSAALPQTDLFGGWTSRPANDKNVAILARKLDSAIDRVQNLLVEAGGR